MNPESERFRNKKNRKNKGIQRKMSFVYLLESTAYNTYVGATVDVERRLKQHNKVLAGGAHATGIQVARGETWSRVCYVSGFPDWQAALQFEWRWKQLSRKLSPNMRPVERRLKALAQLLTMERPTTKAKAYTEWEAPPNIIWGDAVAQQFFDSLSIEKVYGK
jgi:predicted GIY-YIG superfamily endonuclease